MTRDVRGKVLSEEKGKRPINKEERSETVQKGERGGSCNAHARERV